MARYTGRISEILTIRVPPGPDIERRPCRSVSLHRCSKGEIIRPTIREHTHPETRENRSKLNR